MKNETCILAEAKWSSYQRDVGQRMDDKRPRNDCEYAGRGPQTIAEENADTNTDDRPIYRYEYLSVERLFCRTAHG
jgi:hypothetical protein